MKKSLVLAVLMVFLLVAPAFAYETPTVIKGVLADGKPAANADYYVWSASSGKLVKSGKLNSTGMVEINLTDSSSYIFAFKTTEYTAMTNYTIPTITAPANQTPVYVTINASSMYYLKVNSTPISVTAKLTPVAYKNFTYSFGTNYTIYTMMPSNVTFPNKTQSGFAFYGLKSIKVGNTEYNNTTTVKVTMAGNTVVVATYEKLPFMISPIMAIGVIGLIGACLIAVLFIRKKSVAKAMMELEKRGKYFRKR